MTIADDPSGPPGGNSSGKATIEHEEVSLQPHLGRTRSSMWRLHRSQTQSDRSGMVNH
jgi:hypothetical protein